MSKAPPSTHTRRQLLAVGGTLSILATTGCLGLFGKSKPIKEVTYKPFKMEIKLREGAEISKLTMIAPDGSSLGSKKVATGQTKVAVPLGRGSSVDFKPLAPGDYKIVAEKDGESKQEKTISLTRSAKVTAISVVRKQDNVDETSWAHGLKFGLKNTGELPIRLTNFQPLKGLGTSGNGLGLIRQNASNTSMMRKKLIASGKTARFKTQYPVLIVDKKNRTVKQANKHFCNGQTIPAVFRLTGTNGFKKDYSFKITYSGDAIELTNYFACPKVAINQNSSTESS